jgi:hypothetical protein
MASICISPQGKVHTALQTFIILAIVAANFVYFNQEPLKSTCKESLNPSGTVPDKPARKKL